MPRVRGRRVDQGRRVLDDSQLGAGVERTIGAAGTLGDGTFVGCVVLVAESRSVVALYAGL